MIVYIAGPMTGIPDYNHAAFNSAAEKLRADGHTVLNPAEHFDGDTSRPYADYMRASVEAVLKAEAVAFLSGHEKSRGAQLELAIAHALGLEVFPAP